MLVVDGLGHAQAVSELEGQLYARMHPLERRHHQLEERRQLEGHAGAEANLADLAVANVTNGCRDALCFAQQFRGKCVERLAFRGQVHAPVAVHKQLGAQQALQAP